MTETEKQKILPRVIEDEMKLSYLDYAMSVIVGRALPDVRDGLKPVHRRILYAMNDMGMLHNKPFKKSARIVGDVLGKYHPHGDSAIYDALVRLAQPFSMRYTLINGQGNFGSIDGDRAAAMRYTEAKLQRMAEEILQDIDKETVSFVPNFDGSLKEPSVLPSKAPNLLINGSSGIAVGMATNIPPHNLSEVADATVEYIDNPECSVAKLMSHIQGPDFPTGGTILGRSGIIKAYETGKGLVRVRARTEVEEKGTRERIIVKEIPYMINKANLIEQIADLVRDKVITGISDIRDESDREGMRIVIEIKKDASTDVVLNQLYAHSNLKSTFGINLLALVDNQPKVMGLRDILGHFVDHRKEMVTRRTKYDLDKAEKRAHVLEGLTIALDNIDSAVQLIKSSSSADAAKNGLMKRFDLSETQSQAILEMRLQKLTSLEQDKIRSELKEIKTLIQELRSILASEKKVYDIIKEEMKDLKEKYGDERRTGIESDFEEIDMEDLIEEEDVLISISHMGYIKRVPIDTYRKQNRGGKGIIGATVKDEDFIQSLFVANTHSYILFFTDRGTVHWVKVHQVPEGRRQARGKSIANLIQVPSGVRVTAFVPVKEFDDKHYLLMGTRKGVIKKTLLSHYSRPRKGGIRGINLDEGDSLIEVKMTSGDDEIILATRKGMAVRFHEKDARPMGRTSRGVRGIMLSSDDVVVSMVIAEKHKAIFTITENGYGKRTKVDEYRLISRGGKGVRNIRCSSRNGDVVNALSVSEGDEIVCMSRKGITMRTGVKGVSVIGRDTQGVRIMKLSPEDEVVSVAKIISDE